MKILVVDDDDLIRMVMVQALQSAGYETDESPDGTDAIKKLEQDHFDLVVTDLVMPGDDGVSVTNHVRNSGLRIPMLAVSSCPDGGSLASLLDFARTFSEDVIGKPFTKEQLLEAVERVACEAGIGRAASSL